MSVIGSKLDPVTKEMLSLHEMYRRLGYLPEQIRVFFGSEDNKGRVLVALQHRELEFLFDMVGGRSEKLADVEYAKRLELEWPEAVDWWNTADAADLAEVLHGSYCWKHQLKLIVGLNEKGIYPL